MGEHRDHAANMQDERRRSLRVGQADVGAHRQPLAQQRYRGPDALELQVPRLNGARRALTFDHGDRDAAGFEGGALGLVAGVAAIDETNWTVL